MGGRKGVVGKGGKECPWAGAKQVTGVLEAQQADVGR